MLLAFRPKGTYVRVFMPKCSYLILGTMIRRARGWQDAQKGLRDPRRVRFASLGSAQPDRLNGIISLSRVEVNGRTKLRS
jgi:hypothetical protein